MAGRISDRDRVFAQEYMIDLDAKNAAIRAGYKPSTAREAYRWVDPNNPAKPKLRELIEQKMAERSRHTEITIDSIEQRLLRIANADIADIVDLETGKIRKNISRGSTSAIASVKIKKNPYNENTEIEIRMENRIAASELLGKHRGMFAENVNISAAVPVIADDIKGE